jgi:hypothetical protein
MALTSPKLFLFPVFSSFVPQIVDIYFTASSYEGDLRLLPSLNYLFRTV